MKNKGMELYAIACGFMPLPYIRMVFFQTGKSGTVPDLEVSGKLTWVRINHRESAAWDLQSHATEYQDF